VYNKTDIFVYIFLIVLQICDPFEMISLAETIFPRAVCDRKKVQDESDSARLAFLPFLTSCIFGKKNDFLILY